MDTQALSAKAADCDGALIRWVRRIPIAWRIPLAVFLNAAAALTVGLIGWYGASTIDSGVHELRLVHERGRKLTDIDAQAGRLQSLIRQYLNAPTDEVMKEISRRSEDLFQALAAAGEGRAPVEELVQLNEAARRFVSGFQRLKSVNDEISRIYEAEISQAAAEMSGLYAVLNASMTQNNASLTPGLVKSHENFVAAIIDINTFYFSADPLKADAAHRALGELIQSIPRLSAASTSELQREALTAIGRRSIRMDEGIEAIAAGFDDRARVLARDIDSNQVIMASAVDRLMAREAEAEARVRTDAESLLSWSAALGIGLGLGFLAFSILAGWIIGRSIRNPLLRLRYAMEAGAKGDWSGEIEAAPHADELGAMARTIAVFRNNALEKARLEAVGERLAAQDQDAQRRMLQNILLQMDAHESGVEFSRLAVPSASRNAQELAKVFNAVVDRFTGLTAKRNDALAETQSLRRAVASMDVAKSEFLSALTDKLTPPLSMIAHCLNRMDSSASPEARRAAAEAADGAVESLQKIVGAAQDFAALDSGAVTPCSLPLDLPALCQDCIAQSRDAAKDKGIGLRVFVDPAAAQSFLGDPNLIRRILVELISNAVRVTRRGRVSIHLRPAPAPSGGLRISVADTGPGIAQDDLARLFTPFSQINFSSVRNAGLGLSIVDRIAAVCGGHAQAHSEPGAGATFTIDLSLTQHPQSDETHAAQCDLMGLRLLVLSPHSSERAMIARWTEQSGAAVVRVANSESAKIASERAVDTQAPFDLAIISTDCFTREQAAMVTATPFLLIGAPDPEQGLERHPFCLGISAAGEPSWALLTAVSNIAASLRR